MKHLIAILLTFLACAGGANAQKKKVKFTTPVVVPEKEEDNEGVMLLPPIMPSGTFYVSLQGKKGNQRVKVSYSLHGNNNTVLFFDSLTVSVSQAQNAITQIAVANWKEEPLLKCDNIKSGNNCFFDLSALPVAPYKLFFYDAHKEAVYTITFQKDYPILGTKEGG